MAHAHSFILIAVAIFSTLALNAKSEKLITITDEHLDPEYLSTSFANGLIHQIVRKFQNRNTTTTLENEEKGNLIPPDLIGLLPDIPFDDGGINFDSVLLSGRYDYTNTKLEGLNTLWDDLLIYIQTPFTVTYGIGLRDFAIRGNYSLDLDINITRFAELFPDLGWEDLPEEELIVPFTGRGGYELGFKNLHLNASLAFNIAQGRIVSVNTGLTLGLDAVLIYFQDLVFSELPFEDLWDFLNPALKDAILSIWDPISVTLTELLDLILTDMFKDCLILDFLMGDLSCTGLFPPRVTPPPELTTPDEDPGSDHSSTPGDNSGVGSIVQSSVLLVTIIIASLFQLLFPK